MSVFIKGLLTSAGLIMAIGSQNAFVLKNGLQKNHVLLICTICFFCDFCLMSLGVLGMGSALAGKPALISAFALFGGVFLSVYGGLSFKKAFFQNHILEADKSSNTHSRKAAVFGTLAVTLLNPHVYLDTVVLIGSIAGTLTAAEKVRFLAGALLTSFVWFFALGLGARLLQPLFRQARAWKILECVIGCVMWWIAFGLFRFAYLNGF
ncbi:LysE/ArgO family amino acid transporter [Conchiformibius steedae]|uniref:Amino acid transporter n=1 Tax=Conchiformibius steedae TaxID=153493 RepID=A0A3P2A652_9NEIS|nr:LysE/ArgO family amino acid transporter [Conchiformibius steedae]RRD90927.1 amino acid transporter [Conchiformibius steedae]